MNRKSTRIVNSRPRRLGHRQTRSLQKSGAPEKSAPNAVNPRPGAVLEVSPDRLSPHPLNAKIYGDQPATGLAESIARCGVLQPLLVTADGVIVAGEKRWAASKEAGLSKVPVITVGPRDDSAAGELMIHSNRQRIKTNEEIVREIWWLMKFEREKARSRQAAAGRNKVPATSPEGGEAREAVAAALHVGIKKVDQSVAVVDKLDELDGNGDDAESGELRRMLAQSVNRAFNRVKVLNLRGAKVVPEPAPPGETDGDTKAEILVRIQENLIDGVETWSIEELTVFEKDLGAFRADWELHHREVA